MPAIGDAWTAGACAGGATGGGVEVVVVVGGGGAGAACATGGGGAVVVVVDVVGADVDVDVDVVGASCAPFESWNWAGAEPAAAPWRAGGVCLWKSATCRATTAQLAMSRIGTSPAARARRAGGNDMDESSWGGIV
jgi:hypothetical protein